MICQTERQAGPDVIHRCKDNPLVVIEDLPFRCSDIWNAGVVRFDGRYLLLMMVDSLS